MSQSAAFEAVARDAAWAGGRVLTRRFAEKKPLAVESKGLHDFVTEVDREAEAAVTECIAQRFPDHAVMAEEGSPDAGLADYRWIVDPLDGTTNFVHGVPVFAVSVAPVGQPGLELSEEVAACLPGIARQVASEAGVRSRIPAPARPSPSAET